MSDHRLRESGGCSVIDVAPAYTRESFMRLLDVARGVVAEGRPHLVLNMDEVPNITSEGIGLLVLVHDECTRAGGGMVLARVPKRVERVLDLAGVMNFFSIYPDEPAAVGALEAAAPEVEAAPAAAQADVQAPEQEEHPYPEEALREIVGTVVKSRRHQQVIEFFMERTKAAPLDEVAGVTKIPRPVAERILQDLAAAGVVTSEGDLFVWEPSPDAVKKLNIFKNALSDPNLRSRVLAWIYAEEKKV